MDLKQTGKFISEMRKARGLTQVQLAGKVNVSEKTVSKWECGNGFPDTSLILPLCHTLGISANELLAAKKLDTNEEYKKSAENHLIELKGQNEKNNKSLLRLEVLLIYYTIVLLIGCSVVISYVEMATVFKILLLSYAFINVIVVVWVGIIIETKVGYYECANCHNKYIPTYKQTIWSMHRGRTRHLKCPKCGKRTWNKKTINQD